jgi:type IV secretion system protein VirB2
MRKRTLLPITVVAVVLFAAAPAFAAAAGVGGGMPWEGPLDRLATSLQGPVARVAGIVAIVLVGLGFAFSEGGSGMRKVLWVVAGLTIAFNAARWALPFLGFSGGVLV